MIYSIDKADVRKAELIANQLLERAPGSKLVIEDDGLTLGVTLDKTTIWICRRLIDERDGAHGWYRVNEDRLDELEIGLKTIKLKEKEA